MKEKDDDTISIGDAAKLLRVSDVRIRQLADLGFIERSGRGKYSRINVVHGYIDFLKDEARRASKTAAFSRMQDAKAAKIEMELAEKRGELVPFGEVEFLFTKTFGALKSRLLGVSARASRDLTIRRVIDAEIAAALNDTAAQLREIGRAIAAGLDPISTKMAED